MEHRLRLIVTCLHLMTKKKKILLRFLLTEGKFNKLLVLSYVFDCFQKQSFPLMFGIEACFTDLSEQTYFTF